MNKKVLSLICTGAIVASITISSVFAAPANSFSKEFKRPLRPTMRTMTDRPKWESEQKAQFKEKRIELLKERINALVSEGKISKEDADAALEILNSNDENINFGALPNSIKKALTPHNPMARQKLERPKANNGQQRGRCFKNPRANCKPR